MSTEIAKPPQQARSQESLDRLLQAARELIAERGREAPSVADIAARAECSVGCFYGRFKDKASLYAFLDRQLFEESTTCWREFLDPEKWQGRSVNDLIQETVSSMVDSYRHNAALLRALYMHWRKRPPDEPVRSAAGEHYAAIFRWYADLLNARRDEITHPNPTASAAFLIELLESVLIERIVFAEDRFSSSTDTDAELEAELIRVVRGYLGVTDSPTSPNASAFTPQPGEETLI